MTSTPTGESEHRPPEVLLALDFGGTKLTAGIADATTLTWCEQRTIATPPSAQQGRDAMVKLAAKTLEAQQGPLLGTGISFGGPVDSVRGVVRQSMHVTGWDDFPLAAYFANQFAAPARLVNDARAGALGEWRFGSGNALGSLFYLTISTGIGGGLVIDGRPVDGAAGLAGEIGHLTVRPDGPPCSCGRRGCLEAVASGPSIARTVARQVANCPDRSPDLAKRHGANGRLTCKDVAEVAAAGDVIAIDALATAGRAVGFAVAAVTAVANPDVVAIGGGVAKSGDAFWQPLRETARAFALPAAMPSIVRAVLIDTAPLAGALTLAEQAAEKTKQGR